MFQNQANEHNKPEQEQQNNRLNSNPDVAADKEENISKRHTEQGEENQGNEPEASYIDMELLKRKQIKEQNEGGF